MHSFMCLVVDRLVFSCCHEGHEKCAKERFVKPSDKSKEEETT